MFLQLENNIYENESKMTISKMKEKKIDVKRIHRK
jgi:hypothetical protein